MHPPTQRHVIQKILQVTAHALLLALPAYAAIDTHRTPHTALALPAASFVPS